MEYVYAALLLHKLGKPVDEDGIKKIIQATGVAIDDSKLKSLIASLQGVDIDKELENAVVASAALAVSGDSLAEEKAEEKPKEEKQEAAAAGLSSLFG